MILLVTLGLVPFQLNRLLLVRLLPDRTGERETGRHLRQRAFRRHRLFEVEQDPTADDAVEHSGGGAHKSAELRLTRRKPFRV